MNPDAMILVFVLACFIVGAVYLSRVKLPK